MKRLSKKLSLIAALAGLAAAAATSHAVINPKLQPWHLVKGYVNVVACSVTAIDAKARTAELKLEGVSKGDFAAKAITLKLANDVPGEGACLSAAFVEYNGDGYPDVVVSREEGGLSLYVNPGKAGGVFADKTEAAGLAEEKNGAGKTGYFEVCDWDLDGRCDLIYVAGQGLLLWQNDKGAFEASPIAEQDKDFTGGTAAFGTIVRPGTPTVYLVGGENKALICDSGGNLTDVIGAGNEIQDPVGGLLMTLAEDLNCDGTVDLYAASKLKGASSFYVANRGYGSFLLPEKYKAGKVFPPAVYNQPAWGLAAGDVNGDGAPDLLVGGLDGKLWLLVNETLADRPKQADAATTNDVRKQIQARIVTVRPPVGKGALGSRLTLLDDKGKAVTHRWIGTNVGVGCCGPAEFNLAVREPGRYTLCLRLGNGAVREQPLTIDEKTPRHKVVAIP